MNRFKQVSLFVVALLVVYVLLPFQDTFTLNEDIHTRRFCAYGQVYVEFEQGNKIWGTTYLDEQGKTVRCADDDVQHTVSNKETI